MQLHEITHSNPDLLQSINHLLEQLSSSGRRITQVKLDELIQAPNSHLFMCHNNDGAVVGMITVGIYQSPTGKKACIEDVVVDMDFRGNGCGRKMMEHVIAFCTTLSVTKIMLSSRPTRIAANQLYQSLGFVQKETNFYTLTVG